ncbi:hypothetical protein BA190_22355 [Labrys sp. WJW]|nr:hypothetical protein BA190_22355 [Labrys sp. WJW]
MMRQPRCFDAWSMRKAGIARIIPRALQLSGDIEGIVIAHKEAATEGQVTALPARMPFALGFSLRISTIRSE